MWGGGDIPSFSEALINATEVFRAVPGSSGLGWGCKAQAEVEGYGRVSLGRWQGGFQAEEHRVKRCQAGGAARLKKHLAWHQASGALPRLLSDGMAVGGLSLAPAPTPRNPLPISDL